MFFRIWFLYLSKVFILGIVLVGVGIAFPGPWQTIGTWLVIMLGIAGALLAVVMLIKRRLACPICGGASEFVMHGKKPAVECDRCGMVYCKSPSLSFKLGVIPFEDSETDDAG